jgi:hypothetical protein
MVRCLGIEIRTECKKKNGMHIMKMTESPDLCLDTEMGAGLMSLAVVSECSNGDSNQWLEGRGTKVAMMHQCYVGVYIRH